MGDVSHSIGAAAGNGVSNLFEGSKLSGLLEKATEAKTSPPTVLKSISGADAHEEKLVTAVWGVTAFVTLLTLLLLFAPRIHHMKYLNESAASVLVGFICGALILYLAPGSHLQLQFSETLFFVAFLPPVIFAAGFNAPIRSFFNNLMTIISFGVFGTLISTVTIAFGIHVMFPRLGLTQLRMSDCLLMGCIFSATDSVATLSTLDKNRQPRLYAMVFGEGVLNDATSIVLVRALLSLRKSIDTEAQSQSRLTMNVLGTSDYLSLFFNFLWLFSTSLATGIVFGLFSSWFMRSQRQSKLLFEKLNFRKMSISIPGTNNNADLTDDSVLYSPKNEVAMLALLGYLSYLFSEGLQLSGILTVFATGLVMTRYTTPHISSKGTSAARILFAAASSVSEHTVLLYCGFDSLDVQKWGKLSFFEGVTLYISILVFIACGRALFVFPVISISNASSDSRNQIPRQEAIAVWWAGLVRGAVSIALAYHVFSNNLGKSFSRRNASIIAVTLAVVLSTTVVLGCMTKSVMSSLFGDKLKVEDEEVASGELSLRPTTRLELMWRNIETRYINKYFGVVGESPSRSVTSAREK